MSNRPAIPILLAVCLGLGCRAGIPESMGRSDRESQAPRAIWIWERETFTALDDTVYRDDLIEFLKNHNIGTAYIYADSYKERNPLADNPEKYRSLIRAMHRERIAVHALLGSIHLHTEEYVLPEKKEEAVAMIRRIFDYNSSVRKSERFDGINVDIEPHVLLDWKTRKAQIAGYFLDLADLYMRMKATEEFEGEIGPAIPFWFDSIEIEWRGTVKPLSEHTQDIYDHIAIMDYRDRALGSDGFVRHASNELAYADLIGKRVIVGIETGRTDLEKLTFHDDTPADLEGELALGERSFAKFESFAGYAIHHYDAYRRWLRTNS